MNLAAISKINIRITNRVQREKVDIAVVIGLRARVDITIFSFRRVKIGCIILFDLAGSPDMIHGRPRS